MFSEKTLDLLNQGATLMAVENFAEAADTFEEEVKESPEFIDCYINSGNAYASIEEFDKAIMNMYTTKNKIVQDGMDQTNESFFTEYIHKLCKVYDKMTTAKGKEISLKRKDEAEFFYNNLYCYLDELYVNGNSIIDSFIE